MVLYIEDIYFFEVNIKYISSSAMKKKQYFSRLCSTSENTDIFTAGDEIYLVFPEKSKFSFYFIHNGNKKKHNLTFSLVVLVRFDFRSVFIGYNNGCKHSFHLKNGLESYFNE